jgi:hypothetical protein
VPLHVLHRAVASLGQPVGQTQLVLRQGDARNPDLLEAEFPAPVLDRLGKCIQVHE